MTASPYAARAASHLKLALQPGIKAGLGSVMCMRHNVHIHTSAAGLLLEVHVLSLLQNHTFGPWPPQTQAYLLLDEGLWGLASWAEPS